MRPQCCELSPRAPSFDGEELRGVGLATLGGMVSYANNCLWCGRLHPIIENARHDKRHVVIERVRSTPGTEAPQH
jgi:hypothetical protein